MKAVVVLGSEPIDNLASSGVVTDLRVTCRSIGEEVLTLLEELTGSRPYTVSSVRDAVSIAASNPSEDLIIVDAHTYHTNYREALSAVLDAFVAQGGEPTILASSPVVLRGIRLQTSGSTVTRIGEGEEAFAGILVAPASRIAETKASTWRELLERLTPAPLARPRYVWIKLEKHFDILIAQLYKLDELRETRISTNARIAPTAVIEGPVYIDHGVRIDHYAVIKGPVMLCKGSFVGIHAVVRSYTLLAPYSRIGSQTETYVTSMQRGATLSSKVYATGTVVGENAKIEAFTVTRVIYGQLAADKLRITAPPPAELRIGAALEANTIVKAHTTLEPATIVKSTNTL